MQIEEEKIEASEDAELQAVPTDDTRSWEQMRRRLESLLKAHSRASGTEDELEQILDILSDRSVDVELLLLFAHIVRFRRRALEAEST